MTSNPFAPPEASVLSSALPNLRPLTIRYTLQLLPVGQEMKHTLLKTRFGLILLLFGAGSVALLFIAPGMALIAFFLFVWFLVSWAFSLRKPVFGKRGEALPVELSVSSGGVRITGGGETIEKRWVDLSHYSKGQGLLVIHPNKGPHWPVLTAELAAADSEELRSWLAASLPDKPRQAPPQRTIGRTFGLWILLILMFWAIYQIISQENAP